MHARHANGNREEGSRDPMTPEPTPTCDTPRTIAAKAAHEKWRWLGYSQKQRSPELKAPSGWEFSETLERELAAANDRIRHLEETLDVERVTDMESQASRLAAALADLLVLSECADETGYVDDHGFLDVDAIHDAARRELTSWRGKGGA